MKFSLNIKKKMKKYLKDNYGQFKITIKSKMQKL